MEGEKVWNELYNGRIRDLGKLKNRDYVFLHSSSVIENWQTGVPQSEERPLTVTDESTKV